MVINQSTEDIDKSTEAYQSINQQRLINQSIVINQSTEANQSINQQRLINQSIVINQ